MERPTCESCPCYNATDGYQGECHLAPPQMIVVDGEITSVYSTVGKSFWCASHPEFNEWILERHKEEVKHPCRVQDCGRECSLEQLVENPSRGRWVCIRGHQNGYADMPAQQEAGISFD